MIKIFYNNARAPKIQELETERDGCWVYVQKPTEAELEQLAERHELELDLLRDAIDPNESPRIEREAGKTYIFTRYCLMEGQRLITAPLLIVYADKVLITVSHRAFPNLPEFLEGRIDFLTTQKAKLTLQLLSQINRTYARELNVVSKQIWQIRAQLSSSGISNQHFVKFIDIEDTLNDFVSALDPMNSMLRNSLAGTGIRFYEDDRDLIEDLTLGTAELIQLAKSKLKTITNIREAYSTIAANNLNRVVKLMASLTILITIPNIITSAYGMNMRLPLGESPHAFWIICGFIFSVVLCIAWLFRRNKWF